MLTSASVKARARALGFDACGVAPAMVHPRLARLRDWIALGRAGDMHYLADSLDDRLDPLRVLPTARSVISLATVYNTPDSGGAATADPDRVAIARYARGDDYHDVLRERMRKLLRWMADEAGTGLEAVSCVDYEPIQERVFAEQAGVGWIGKNTCVINPSLGSWLFLSEILTNADLDPDAPAVDQCGTCTRCLDACPTSAIVEPYAIDATRCLSYLTIETRAAIDDSLRPEIHAQVYGCDICQDVCPWNRRAATTDDAAWQARPGLAFPRLLDACRLSDDQWRARLKGSAMRRAGVRRIRRSLAFASAHLPAPDRAAALDALAGHASGAYPEVADAIAWSRTE